MKRITLGLLMASSCAAPAFAADQDQPAASAEAPAKASRFNIFVEGGFLFNNNVGALPYAEYYGPNDHSQETNTRYPFKNGSGDGYEISAGAGFHINDRISLNAAYTGLRTSRSANTG
ncbi:MAG TPA: hypothetical protein VN222_00815, partial [Novosphingobium sp.]|nr:hypothetical protein [Novosphingobium sp.]